MGPSPKCQFGAAGGRGFLEEIGQVFFDGAFGDEQLVGDVAVALAADQFDQDIVFARGHADFLPGYWLDWLVRGFRFARQGNGMLPS